MAIWNFTLNGQPAKKGITTFSLWDDGTCANNPSDAEFGKAETRARRLGAYLGTSADTVSLLDGSLKIRLPQISYNPSTGTATIKNKSDGRLRSIERNPACLSFTFKKDQ